MRILAGAILFFTVFYLNAQEKNDNFKPFLKIGLGYINEIFMIDGTVISGEAGIILPNNYTISINYKLFELINDKAVVFNTLYNIDAKELIINGRIAALYFGYDFHSRNRKHSVFPQAGAYYASEKGHDFNQTENKTTINLIKSADLGIALELNYLFHFKKGISIGLNGSWHIGYIMGPNYYSFSPIIALGF